MTLGCRMRRRMSTSERRLSRSLLLSRSMAISFTATSVPRAQCRPSHTCEYAPDPIGRSSSYSPTRRPPPPPPPRPLAPSPIAPVSSQKPIAPSRVSRGRRRRAGEMPPRGEATVSLLRREGERRKPGQVVFTRGGAGPLWSSLSAAHIRFRRLSQDSPCWNLICPFMLATKAIYSVAS